MFLAHSLSLNTGHYSMTYFRNVTNVFFSLLERVLLAIDNIFIDRMETLHRQNANVT